MIGAIKVGGVYRAKMPQLIGEENSPNDRLVLRIDEHSNIYYKNIINGREASVSKEGFLKWAGNYLGMQWEMETLTELSRRIHTNNVKVGWWNEYLPNKMKRHETAMILVVTEIAEATEGMRKNLMDDHLPQYPMVHVELADAAIRLLDLAGAYKMGELDRLFQPLSYEVEEVENRTGPECLWYMVWRMARATGRLEQVRTGLRMVFLLVDRFEVPEFRKIISEKLEYNYKRHDHKREQRNQQGGKKF